MTFIHFVIIDKVYIQSQLLIMYKIRKSLIMNIFVQKIEILIELKKIEA